MKHLTIQQQIRILGAVIVTVWENISQPVREDAPVKLLETNVYLVFHSQKSDAQMLLWTRFLIVHRKKNKSAIANIQPIAKAKSVNRPHEMKKMNLEQNPLSFADTKMIAAFGIPMVNSEGSPRIELWDNIWKRVI